MNNKNIKYLIKFETKIQSIIKIKCKEVPIQGVPGGKDLTSGECSLGQTIPI